MNFVLAEHISLISGQPVQLETNIEPLVQRVKMLGYVCLLINDIQMCYNSYCFSDVRAVPNHNTQCFEVLS